MSAYLYDHIGSAIYNRYLFGRGDGWCLFLTQGELLKSNVLEQFWEEKGREDAVLSAPH